LRNSIWSFALNSTTAPLFNFSEIENWENITLLSCGFDRLDVFDKDGIVHSTVIPDEDYHLVADKVESLHDIVQISSDYNNYIAMSNTGYNYTYVQNGIDYADFDDEASTWTNIVSVASVDSIAGLKSNGTVVMTKSTVD